MGKTLWSLASICCVALTSARSHDCQMEMGKYICDGHDAGASQVTPSYSDCAKLCASNPACMFWSYHLPHAYCWLKTDASCTGPSSDWVYGNRECGEDDISTSATTPSPGGSCRGGIQAYPGDLPNAWYYTRLCTTQTGLKVVSSSKASNEAIERTAFLIDKVTANVSPAVLESMNYHGFRHAVMAAYPYEVTTNIPEHSFLGPYWDERARGLGATIAVPTGSNAEENALCYPDDRYLGEDITIHEFGHSLHLLGLAPTYTNFNSELTSLYYAARSSGAYSPSHYAMTDFKEYFAEGVQSYYNANMPSNDAPTDYYQLQQYDPGLFNFIQRYLGASPWTRVCP